MANAIRYGSVVDGKVVGGCPLVNILRVAPYWPELSNFHFTIKENPQSGCPAKDWWPRPRRRSEGPVYIPSFPVLPEETISVPLA